MCNPTCTYTGTHIHVNVCGSRGHTNPTPFLWQPEGHSQELILSFHHVCSRDWAQVVRKCHYLLRNLTGTLPRSLASDEFIISGSIVRLPSCISGRLTLLCRMSGVSLVSYCPVSPGFEGRSKFGMVCCVCLPHSFFSPSSAEAFVKLPC